MLVLSRKCEQKIVINNEIVVTVIAIRGDKVRLGIEAPPDVPVHRREIYEAIHKHAKAAEAAEATEAAGSDQATQPPTATEPTDQPGADL
ncbi:MAG: carbon storage regulator CsrA [Planctomycetales bacterium]|nr:carbon storage regulator CsrA [Planctomycetales bacterium]